MNIDKFNKIIRQIKNTFSENKKVLENCIKAELKNGNIISFDSFINEIECAEKEVLNINNGDTKKNIAIIYDGRPETTLNIIINSIYFENKVYLYAEGYELISAVIIKLIENTLSEFKIENIINLYQNVNIEEISENEENYDKIIYIGDYFEYEKVQAFLKKEVEYNSYGHIKVFIDKNKYLNEYKELMKNSYKSNINVEYYSDFEDFLENVNEKDTVIIYEENDVLENLLKKVNTKKVLKHSEFMESYRFSYL